MCAHPYNSHKYRRYVRNLKTPVNTGDVCTFLQSHSIQKKTCLLDHFGKGENVMRGGKKKKVKLSLSTWNNLTCS